MRTTLVIADDVLAAAKVIAQEQSRTVGDVVSDLARRSLRRPAGPQSRNGIPLLATRSPGSPVTSRIVNALREESP